MEEANSSQPCCFAPSTTCSRYNYHIVTICRSDRIAKSTKKFPTSENNNRSTTTSSLDRVQPIIPKPATDYYHINFNDLYTSFSTDKKHLEERLEQKQKSETEVNNVVTAADHDSNIPQIKFIIL
jgi:glycerol-3-phosphate cytidylyltransferase-like family protein